MNKEGSAGGDAQPKADVTLEQFCAQAVQSLEPMVRVLVEWMKKTPGQHSVQQIEKQLSSGQRSTFRQNSMLAEQPSIER